VVRVHNNKLYNNNILLYVRCRYIINRSDRVSIGTSIIYILNIYKYYVYGGRTREFPCGERHEVRSGCPEIKNRPENGEAAARAVY